MNSKTHNIIPDSEAHCVWMDAGLVDYKLCTERFECESCPFDAVMKEQHHTFAEQAALRSGHLFSDFPHERETGSGNEAPAERFLSPLKSISIPDDRIYFSNHTWLKPMRGGLFRTGIDAFLARLIYPIGGVATVLPSSHVERGEPFAWLIRDSAMFAVNNSEKGTVSFINGLLTDHPSLVTGDSYGEGWLMTIAIPGDGPADLKFFTADEFTAFIGREIEDIRLRLMPDTRSAGRTMYDGGIRVSTIENFIGEKRYHKLISRLLSPH